MKALIVCLSSDLPHSTARDCNTMYFVYDKQVLYDGQSPYSSTFSIVEEMPAQPAIDRYFIDLSDGIVKLKDDYQLHNYAEVQNEAMLDILKQAGTIHFYNSKQQYIDGQTRVLSTPFSDGTYQLTVDIPNDILFNQNTILKYNPETGGFEIYGETDQGGRYHKQVEQGLRSLRKGPSTDVNEDIPDDLNVKPLETTGWYGHETETVKTIVEDNRIKAEVKVSESDNNILTVLEDGIYAYPHDMISQEEFDSWKKCYDDYKSNLNWYIDNIEKALADIEEIISPEVVDAKIKAALEAVIPDLEHAIAEFDELYAKLLELYGYSERYADETVAAAVADIDAQIEDALDNAWEDISDQPEPEPGPDPEPDPE